MNYLLISPGLARVTALLLLFAAGAFGDVSAASTSSARLTEIQEANQRIESSKSLEFIDTASKSHRPLNPPEGEVTVLFFVMHDCPKANQYAPEIHRLISAYHGKKVRFYVVYSEPDLSASDAAKHAQDFKIACPALLDPHQKLARAVGATVSPEVALLSPLGVLTYRGRIDDRFSVAGKARVNPKTRDLVGALDSLLAGRPLVTPFTQATGCYLPFHL